ncbi:MAG: type IX secretion system sortase PorU [bacterium]
MQKIKTNHIAAPLAILLVLHGANLCFGQRQRSEPAIQMLSSDATGLTIAFAPKNWREQVFVDDGVELTRIDFQGAVLKEQEGNPQIPYHVAVVGMPVGARLRVRIVESDYESRAGVRLAPFPKVKRVDGWPVREVVYNPEIYGQAQSFPSELVRVDKPVFFRDQQIVRIQVAGAQFLPAQNRLLKYRRIIVQVSFEGGQTAPAETFAVYSESEERLYRNVLLNYETARRWRKRRKQVDFSKQAAFQGTTFYRFNIQDEGIYKIDGRFLESEISGLSLASIDPSKIRLFNNGGRELPRDIDAPRPEGLVENAIVVDDDGDGRFDRDDFILFYARGVNGWEYDPQAGEYKHYINHFTFSNTYWLSLDGQQEGKRMSTVTSGTPGAEVIETYQGMTFVEEEKTNRLNSGLNWFGQGFAVDEFSRSHTWRLAMPNARAGEEGRFEFRFAALNQGTHRFTIRMNGKTVASTQFSGLLGDFSGSFLRMRLRDETFSARDVMIPGENELELSYAHSATFGQAFLDWFEIFYPAQMQAVEDELVFSVVPSNGLRTYRVSGFSSSDIQLFDVTDFSEAKRVTGGTLSNGILTFADVQEADAPKRYAAVSASKFRPVENLERTEFRDLRDPAAAENDPAEFVIITHNDFFSQAERLESFRENGSPTNRLATRVVRLTDIFDNFSGGLFDPTAIRDFLKHAFENWRTRPLYVLLLGDGTYDYKNSTINFIPTFQSDELGDENQRMLRELESRTTDSWFTYLDESNDFPGTPVMDMVIGRLNAQTIADAKNVIDKIIDYESRPQRGNWRNTITIVGDDELVTGGQASAQDAALHIPQAESLAETYIPRSFEVQKIYLSEFPKVTSAAIGGFTKPAAKETLLRQMNQGTLIVNYIGHGNSSLWAHEHIFETSDNDRVQNQDKLIFFVAATCDWALFDDPSPSGQSQAEDLLLAEDRGAIAVLSSARLVFSSTNFSFSKKYYDNLFTEAGSTSRIGEAFVITRIQNNSRVNDEKYHIYGDPTLRLAVPQQQAVITSMTPDSILALSTIEVEGEIRQDSQLASTFNGTAFINTLDSRRFVVHKPEAGSNQEYFLPGNSIYRGTVPVTNGVFKARFIVPKDISYGGRQARVGVYFWNDELDGSGFRENIVVSSSTANLVDGQGPQIRIYFREHENFTTGDIVDESVTMVVDLADTISGINIAGEIGHRLTLSIDPNEETCLSQLNRFQGTNIIDLTDLFQFNEGDHLAGKVEFPLHFPAEVDIAGSTVRCQSLEGEQRHRLVVKAWDNSNNSSTAAAEVLVVHEEGLVLREVMNYPNPFRDRTTFTFFANQDAEVRIKIYTVAGQLIQTVEYLNVRNGFNMIDWDGRDAQGDIPANGVYLYKLIAKAQGSNGLMQKEAIGRLAIIR